jgi:hypothetical protein
MRAVAPCVVSVAEHAGWAHVLCVAAVGRVPAVIERRRVATIEAGVPTQPYHHESLAMNDADANALVARVRRSVEGCTLAALKQVVADTTPRHAVGALAIRTPTFPELPDSIADVRTSYQLQCAADGMLYQFAWCHAARQLGLAVDLCPRGEEASRAAGRFGVTVAHMEEFVRRTGRPPGAPWTEEHRRAFARGIAALAGHAHGGLDIRSA